MMTRWHQVGAFSPFFRAHGHIDTKRREVYLFDQPYQGIMRDAIRLRYSLLPAMYTAFYESSLSGVPILRFVALSLVTSQTSRTHRHLSSTVLSTSSSLMIRKASTSTISSTSDRLVSSSNPSSSKVKQSRTSTFLTINLTTTTRISLSTSVRHQVDLPSKFPLHSAQSRIFNEEDRFSPVAISFVAHRPSLGEIRSLSSLLSISAGRKHLDQSTSMMENRSTTNEAISFIANSTSNPKLPVPRLLSFATDLPASLPLPLSRLTTQKRTHGRRRSRTSSFEKSLFSDSLRNRLVSR